MQSAERHKTIILLRASTGPEPPEVARGRRSGSLGSHPANIFASQRTQQNKNFVAFEVGMCYTIDINKAIGAF